MCGVGECTWMEDSSDTLNMLVTAFFTSGQPPAISHGDVELGEPAEGEGSVGDVKGRDGQQLSGPGRHSNHQSQRGKPDQGRREGASVFERIVHTCSMTTIRSSRVGPMTVEQR